MKASIQSISPQFAPAVRNIETNSQLSDRTWARAIIFPTIICFLPCWGKTFLRKYSTSIAYPKGCCPRVTLPYSSLESQMPQKSFLPVCEKANYMWYRQWCTSRDLTNAFLFIEKSANVRSFFCVKEIRSSGRKFLGETGEVKYYDILCFNDQCMGQWLVTKIIIFRTWAPCAFKRKYKWRVLFPLRYNCSIRLRE